MPDSAVCLHVGLLSGQGHQALRASCLGFQQTPATFMTSVPDARGRDSLQNVGKSFHTGMADHLRRFHCIKQKASSFRSWRIADLSRECVAKRLNTT